MKAMRIIFLVILGSASLLISALVLISVPVGFELISSRSQGLTPYLLSAIQLAIASASAVIAALCVIAIFRGHRKR